ncbi:MAG: energy-coupling factor transporter transmembrane component T [Rhodovibrionaceae bacterium]
MVGVSVQARWLRRLPAGLKLLALAAISIGLFFIGDPAILAAILAAVLVLLAGVGALGLLRTLRPIGFMLLLAFLAHGLLGDWMLGLTVCLRIGTLVLLATLVSASTALSEMLAVLDRLLAPLRWAGVPTRPVGVAIAMTLRFAPMLAQRWRLLGEAWQARSPRRPLWRLVVPFLLSALDDADHAAEALVARGGFDRR